MMGFLSVFAQSSLVPLAKIANAPTRPLRLLWAAFTATMFMVLCVCITLVVIQYCKHQTVFQLEVSGRFMVYDQIPGITICPQSAEAKKIFSRVVPVDRSESRLPWQDRTMMEQFRERVLKSSPNLSLDAITHRLPVGELTWNTSVTAISPIYRMLHNFTVRFNVQPPKSARSYRLTVMEQVPNTRSFLCTTFELRSPSPNDRWSYLEVEIDQSASIDNPISFTVITHERGELPFSAYDRHIHTIINPNSIISLYFSKAVTSRLQTARNPCHAGPDAKSMAEEFEAEATNTAEDPVNGVIGFPDRIKNWEVSEEQNDWYEDFLDVLRLNLTKHNSTQGNSHFAAVNSMPQKNRDAVLLFGTAFLYSRESCGWAECCRQVHRHCECDSTVHVLRFNESKCRGGTGCEKKHCVDQQISYKVCPLPCVMTKFIKHNEVTVSGAEANVSANVCKLKLIRSESVHVATEEEIFSLAKLFSEVGGLCSLFIGFSCIFLFEIFEALILMHGPNRKTRKNNSRIIPVENLPWKTEEDARDGGNIFQNQCCPSNVNRSHLITGVQEETNVCNNRFPNSNDRSFIENDAPALENNHGTEEKENLRQEAERDTEHGPQEEAPWSNHTLGVDISRHKAVWKDDVLILPVWPAMRMVEDPMTFSNEAGQDGVLTQDLQITPDQILTLLEQKRVKFRLILN